MIQAYGEYGPDNDWLTDSNGRGWAIAYHGTKLENVASIIKNGFKVGPTEG